MALNGTVMGGAEGRPRDPGLPWVPLYCQRDTQKPSHALSPSPGPHALHLLLELQGSALVFGLELDLDTHFFFSGIPLNINILTDEVSVA